MKKEAYLVMSLDNEILAVQGHGLWGWENLRKAIQTVNQFFKLSPGDAVILNDPSCGGLFPWAVTCVQKTDKYLIAHSVRIKTPWAFSQKIDAEGLRIPPTPLIQAGEIQSQIFESLIGHPLAGSDFGIALKKLLSVEILNLKNWPLANSHSTGRLKEILHDIPHAETAAEIKISSGEILKLKMETSEKGFVFNFSGTSFGKECFINETLVNGICREFILKFYDLEPDIGAHLDRLIHLTTPHTSFLQTKFPQGQLHGLARGSGAVLQALQKCFQQVYPRENMVCHNFFPLWFQVKSKTNFDQWVLPNGSGALEKEPGLAAFSVSQIEAIPSIAEIQNFFEIVEYSLTQPKIQSRISAGHGLHLDLVAKSDCEILWIFENSASAMKGDSRRTAHEPCSVMIDGTIQDATGTMSLKSGQRLNLKTGSGASLN